MNDDLEHKLQSLRPHALPAAWRAEILGKAAASARRSTLPPRWLAVGWGLAWAAVVVLHLTTPTESASPLARGAPGVQPRLKERAQTLDALLALNTDTPR